MTPFIQVRFGPLDDRRYTYLNDGEPVAVGDFVKVPGNRGDGWKRVEVMAIDVAEPNFVCRSILGKVTGEDTDRALLAAHDFPAGIDSQ